MTLRPENVRRAITIDEIGKQLYLDLLETPDVQDRMMMAIWLVTAEALSHPSGYEWCKNLVSTAMETAPIDAMRLKIDVLNRARPGK